MGRPKKIVEEKHEDVLEPKKRGRKKKVEEQNTMIEDHYRVSRPWGYYEVLIEAKSFKVKRLMVKPYAKLSLQMHQHRSEHWW